MSIKNLFGITLFIALFIAASIIIFGTTDQYLFPFVYFLLVLMTVSILIFLSRRLFEKKTDWALFIILGLILAFALTFCFSNLKGFYETNKAVSESKNTLNYEIDNLATMNDYYQNYIVYQLGEIEVSKSNSQILQNQINQALQGSGSQSNNALLLTLQQRLTEAYDDIADLEQELVDAQNRPPEVIYVERGEDDD